MQPYILAFDIGTSSCKAALFDAYGGCLQIGKGTYPLHRPAEDRVEQQPQEIADGIRASLAALRRDGGTLETVRAIGISAQMAAHCLVDGEGRPLTPIISWMDRRAKAEVDAYNRQFTQADTARLTGMDMLITPAHTMAKLRWMRTHMPEEMQRALHIVQVKDLLIHTLTGRWVSDPTTLKGMVHQQTGALIPEIMAYTGCPDTLIPPVAMPYELAGELQPGVAGFEDLTPGIPVVVGWNDMNAAFLGMAGLSEGCVGLDLTGTSEHIGIRTDAFPAGFVCDGVNHVPFEGRHEVCYGVTTSGGQALDWFVKGFYAEGDTDAAYARMLGEVRGVPRGEMTPLLFLPYLEGERNPWSDPHARGVFFGLNGTHTRRHMALAVMEGVCFALRTIMDRMPMAPKHIVVAGGASRNDLWNQMKSDVLQIPYARLCTPEAGCNGAAILAMALLRPEATVASIAAEMTGTDGWWTPNLQAQTYYTESYRRFLSLYHRLKPEFERA